MRTPILLAALAATTLGALPAQAQDRYDRQEYREDRRDARQDYREDRREARQDRKQYRRDVRQANRDYRDYRAYDYNRFEPGQRGYYADRYYRAGGNYRPYALGRNDRVYRGQDNRYYCRRSDGTTGLIVGGLAGGALGNIIAGGGSRLLGTLIGAGGGAVLGQSIDRGQVRCR